MGVAHADDGSDAGSADAGSAAAPGGGSSDDQLVLPKGRAVLDAFLQVNLSANEAFKPISVTPDIWYGVSDKLTVGLVHSTWGETGFVGTGIGNSLCLSGSSNGCASVYHTVALDGRYELKRGAWAWAADGGLDVISTSSPFELSLKLGAVGRWHKDKLAVELEPALYIAVSHRSADNAMDVQNRDALAVPVTVLYAAAPKITLAAQVGLLLPLEDTGDEYDIPLSLGVHYRVNEKLDVGLAFTFVELVGGGDSGADLRTLTIGASYAF
nr:hypothetical protein [Kofleriaceae bacterium]